MVTGPVEPTQPDIVVCPEGPILIRGAHVVQGADGVPVPTTRPVSAVCRCGSSARLPWCDGTHKLLSRGTGTGTGGGREGLSPA